MPTSNGRPDNYGKLLITRSDGGQLDSRLKPGGSLRPDPARLLELLIEGPGPIRIGRAEHNELQLPSPEISADHALITAVETGCYLTDLGSTFGTLLGGKPVEQQRSRLLRHGDVISIGPYKLRYERRLELSGIDERWRSSAPALPPEVAAQRWQSERPPQSRPTERPLLQRDATRPALIHDRSEYLQHLPALYHQSNLINDMLLSFQGVWQPIEEIVGAMYCYSNPRIAPESLLSWLASWFDIVLNADWSVAKQRRVIIGAISLFPWRGTRRGLIRCIKLLTGAMPTIIEAGQAGQPTPRLLDNEFGVVFNEAQWNELSVETHELIRRIVEQEKPAGTRARLLNDEAVPTP